MKKKKKSQNKKGFLILLIVVVLAIAVVVGVLVAENKKKSAPQPQESSVVEEPTTREKEEKITNFVIFGIDDVGYTPWDINRSDTIMIVSINQDQNAIALISVLRDSKVPIKGYEPQKINGAYQLGGAPLAIDTLNDNFHLKLRNYITVNFAKMESLIDMIGGVDVELTWEEAEIVNSQNPDSEYVEEGMNHLDGAQALSYSRIRSLDSDQVRVERQQNVMNAVLHQFRMQGTEKGLAMLDPFMETVETSFFYSDLYDILSPLDLSSVSLFRYTVPNAEVDPNRWGGWDENNSWVWEFDIEKTADYINDIVAWK